MVKRIGNWYSVELENQVYNVNIQKDRGVVCDPSTILVFDEEMNKVQDFEIWNKIEKILEKMDWKSDILND